LAHTSWNFFQRIIARKHSGRGKSRRRRKKNSSTLGIRHYKCKHAITRHTKKKCLGAEPKETLEKETPTCTMVYVHHDDNPANGLLVGRETIQSFCSFSLYLSLFLFNSVLILPETTREKMTEDYAASVVSETGVSDLRSFLSGFDFSSAPPLLFSPFIFHIFFLFFLFFLCFLCFLCLFVRIGICFCVFLMGL
jgi:hypothetical protein